MSDTALLWLRNDLRLTDNPALAAAARHQQLVVVAIDERAADEPSASDWWHSVSLARLGEALAARGSRINLLRGDPRQLIPELAEQFRAAACYWNRRYTPAGLAIDRSVEATLNRDGHPCHSFNGALLREPSTLANQQGQPYRVFTPFWNRLRGELEAPTIIAAPDRLPPPPPEEPAPRSGQARPFAALAPERPWTRRLADHWQPGEAAALERLATFNQGAIGDYADGRDRPDQPGTSRLSPHLHRGEISPRQVYAALLARPTNPFEEPGPTTFLAELGWREFAHAILFHFPETEDREMNATFRGFPWRRGSNPALTTWQRGETGIPLVDAGMRELWQTGWMHNRVRMVTASWLTKNLLQDWRDGMAWFRETLVDADGPANTMGWQWVAGCGADAAPYFRIFNPVRQAQRFDPEGAYIARWIPELAPLPPRWRAEPWATPVSVQKATGFHPGRDYPSPQCDPGQSRKAALAAYQALEKPRTG